MKVGLCGMLTVSLAGGIAAMWWGVMLLALGMITAFIGRTVCALMEHNIPAPAGYPPWRISALSLLGLGAFVTRRGDPATR